MTNNILTIASLLLDSPRLPLNKANQSANKQNTSNLPCGWSKQGLETFNKVCTEVNINRQQLGQEFDKAFKKKSMEETMVSTNKTGKRKRHYIETYNDLNDGEQIIANGEK
jgi:hypothetical protein